MRQLWCYLALLQGLLPVQGAFANSHGSVEVRVAVRSSHRPICPIDYVGRGCVAPVRKALRNLGRGIGRAGRFIGRAGFRVAQGVGRAGVGIARGIGRFLFGRQYYC